MNMMMCICLCSFYCLYATAVLTLIHHAHIDYFSIKLLTQLVSCAVLSFQGSPAQLGATDSYRLLL